MFSLAAQKKCDKKSNFLENKMKINDNNNVCFLEIPFKF